MKNPKVSNQKLINLEIKVMVKQVKLAIKKVRLPCRREIIIIKIIFRI